MEPKTSTLTIHDRHTLQNRLTRHDLVSEPGGGGHSHWRQYMYARMARVPFWPTSVPQRVGFSSFANFVPVRVGVSRCRPSRGIHFPGYRPPRFRSEECPWNVFFLKKVMFILNLQNFMPSCLCRRGKKKPLPRPPLRNINMTQFKTKVPEWRCFVVWSSVFMLVKCLRNRALCLGLGCTRHEVPDTGQHGMRAAGSMAWSRNSHVFPETATHLGNLSGVRTDPAYVDEG